MERVVPIAGSNGDLQFLKNLLKQYELNPNFKDENGRTAFMRAVAKNNLEIITYLAELNINLRETTHLRKNVFHIACEQSKLQTLEFLRYKTAREFSKHDIDQTPLHIATFKERYDICKFLLEKKVSVNARDKQGSTPLHIAAMTGNLPLIKLLLDHQAETKVLNVYNKTPSDTACDNENKEAYQLLTSVEIKSWIMVRFC
ncbi:hypothetical protein HELRODRAFT_77602 [Helobdella robusta]|uniref:Uncharacterized protein n=1 Tax=Helobdella robusta TaxID=6412 RepID=T1G304_HELRO|nr:hypothetical protein HELRODRAFT_77602 [Helobdella robusta]ESO05533.1 hypothetical protein HELRODRAFT_77602 [Helobdella robusta]